MADDQDYEAALFDDEDPIGGDLKEKVAEAWRDFARHLVDALRQLAPGTTLDLTLDPTASGTGDAIYSVQVTGEDGDMLAATAVGNADLPPAYRLGRTSIFELLDSVRSRHELRQTQIELVSGVLEAQLRYLALRGDLDRAVSGPAPR